MTTQETPVPYQEQWELETPFGAALVNDWRGPDAGPARALVSFEELTLNNKGYRNVRVYLQTMSGPRDTDPHYYWNITTAWGDLTPAAKRKLTGFLDEQQALKAYLAPLPDEEIRERQLHSLRLALANDLSGIMNRQAPTLEDLAIVLREALEATEAGKAYRP